MTLVISFTAALLAQAWPTYGGDPGGTRYSAAAQISRANVKKLRVAWTFRTGDDYSNANSSQKRAAFETTPILFRGKLYLSTPFNRVFAIDPATGKQIWVFDPKVDNQREYSETTSRGVSAWEGGRIFVATIDARLIALDAATGNPATEFGNRGTVDLAQDMRLRDRGSYNVTSPPAIVGNAVIIGSAIADNGAVKVERGAVRAFDARSGKLLWTWDPIPLSLNSGAANAWAPISADPERDMVFVPTSSPSPDFYGGERKGDNRYANSVVALQASTGKLFWHFQVVHHDLWDYDVASQPTLLTAKGRPAVAVTTKIGHLFVLDRETGEPLIPVEERSVPQSRVPGEEASPTQPFPLSDPLVPQRLSPAEAWGRTEEERKDCADRLRALRSEGLFTPPSLEGTIAFPGNIGGVAWGGAAHDPKRGVLIVNTNRLAFMIQLIPRENFESRRAAPRNRFYGEFAPQTGTPYGMYREPLLSSTGVPCNAPPWSALAAVSPVTGRKIWEVPLAAPDTKPLAIAMGGPLATAGGLVFIGATAEARLRAFDVENGKELWSHSLPMPAFATPMSYVVNGKQYVAIAAGGHGKLGTRLGDYVVAYALP